MGHRVDAPHERRGQRLVAGVGRLPQEVLHVEEADDVVDPRADHRQPRVAGSIREPLDRGDRHATVDGHHPFAGHHHRGHRPGSEVERSGEIKLVTAVVAPRIEFKDGKADKAWIGLKSVEGPGDNKALVSTLTKLHDKAGLFHGSTIKSINKLLYKTCDEEYPAKKH